VNTTASKLASANGSASAVASQTSTGTLTCSALRWSLAHIGALGSIATTPVAFSK
jgi:hypothetical protein